MTDKLSDSIICSLEFNTSWFYNIPAFVTWNFTWFTVECSYCLNGCTTNTSVYPSIFFTLFPTYHVLYFSVLSDLSYSSLIDLAFDTSVDQSSHVVLVATALGILRLISCHAIVHLPWHSFYRSFKFGIEGFESFCTLCQWTTLSPISSLSLPYHLSIPHHLPILDMMSHTHLTIYVTGHYLIILLFVQNEVHVHIHQPSSILSC